tara:strand:+ start:2914 stop:3246 length:333 start_codon:yes stop_codon:yes gene_type:complete
MAYNGKPFFKIPRPLLLAGGVESRVIGDGVTLTDKDSLFQIIDSGGSDENVILPSEKDGRVYAILNNGATNALDVQNDQAVRQVLLGPGDMAVLVSDDTQWYLFLNVSNL